MLKSNRCPECGTPVDQAKVEKALRGIDAAIPENGDAESSNGAVVGTEEKIRIADWITQMVNRVGSAVRTIWRRESKPG